MDRTNVIGFPKPEPVKKISKMQEWYIVKRTEIIPQFIVWGIHTCEIRSYQCINSSLLGFAHTKKRRHITTHKELLRVVLACQPCHNIVEYRCKEVYGMSMTEFLDGIIDNRITYNM